MQQPRGKKEHGPFKELKLAWHEEVVNIQQGEAELFIFTIMMQEIIHEKVFAKILSHRNAGLRQS